jgi:threonine dehydratase
MIPYSWLEEATLRIARYIYKTPLTYDSQNQWFIKWENQQVTGSFKVRGALNKVLSLQRWEQKRGIVTVSAGNHGQGVALSGSQVAARVIVFVSEHAVPTKLEAMRGNGAEIRIVPGGYGEAEKTAHEYAELMGAMWISPYNDGQIIAGQGTLGLELLLDLPNPSSCTWVVPAGGGGLVSGMGMALKHQYPQTHLVAVQSEASAFLHDLYHYKSQDATRELPSLADGLAGPVEKNSLTIPLVRQLVDEFILVSEAEIIQAIAYAWKQYHERIEGSAAVTLAAVMTGKVTARPAVLIISGGNIQPEVFDQILKQVG